MLHRLWHKVASNLRYKLLLLVLAPLLLAPTVLVLASYWAWNTTYQHQYLKVRTDLSIADDIFQRIQADRLQALKSLAESYSFRSEFDVQSFALLASRLSALRSQYALDFLNLLSSDGKAVLRPTGWQPWRGKSSALLDTAIGQGRAAVGIEIYSREELAAVDRELAERIVLPQGATARQATENSADDKAMLIRLLQPVLSHSGVITGLLEGGVLLDRNFRLVDEIRDLVYEAADSLAEGRRGSVMLVFDDVRVSSHTLDAGQSPLLGTRVSAEVRSAVLENRQRWVNRAYIVDNWYISAYQPLLDVNGESVGMLYAGYPESPLRSALLRSIGLLALLLILGTLCATALAIIGAQSIFRPIELIADVIRATKSGRKHRIGALGTPDEIGELARQFDSMLDTLEENQQRIQLAADELELKVAERTVELSAKNKRLEQTITLLRETRQQLAMAEKLAALGELTAGVAHEINNPTAVILGNMDVVIQELGDEGALVQTELDLIIEQVYRIRNTVDRLLQYSRPVSHAGEVERVMLRELIAESLLLVRHELDRKNITTQEHFTDSDPVQINRQELQQVLVNLLLNATHAVPQKGLIRISTEAWGEHGIRLKIRDNGVGIPADELRRIFDPFYTCRKEGGTGLGLSVSYGIIRRYGGHISVNSLLGEWTEFTVRIRFQAVYQSDEESLQEMNSTLSID